MLKSQMYNQYGAIVEMDECVYIDKHLQKDLILEKILKQITDIKFLLCLTISLIVVGTCLLFVHKYYNVYTEDNPFMSDPLVKHIVSFVWVTMIIATICYCYSLVRKTEIDYVNLVMIDEFEEFD